MFHHGEYDLDFSLNPPVHQVITVEASLWARGALTVLPQPQLQGASGTVIAARFELSVSHSLC
jgi:hypothetical protein